MNGEPLPPDHGAVRLIVPAWIGIASIKWVGDIEVSTEPLFSPWNTRLFPPGRSAARTARGQRPAVPADRSSRAFRTPLWSASLPAHHQPPPRGRSWSGAALVASRRDQHWTRVATWRRAPASTTPATRRLGPPVRELASHHGRPRSSSRATDDRPDVRNRRPRSTTRRAHPFPDAVVRRGRVV
ncbi:molybdopterin-dependent oxidoreductase [Streptomyces sp. KL116D]|uniref:molybdopterin-dependent oxidoreductase n=1 Tax=Streptomyces sp. KL116D TaxID=3045152 RepID=UPI0035566448